MAFVYEYALSIARGESLFVHSCVYYLAWVKSSRGYVSEKSRNAYVTPQASSRFEK